MLTSRTVQHGTDSETVWDEDVPRLTPNDRFYVRNHTTAPRIDARSWRLLVSGDGVLRDRVYSLADLQAFTTETYERAVECTGNGRALFAEQQGTPRPGTQWGMGAIGVASWTGVPLRTVLRHAGVRDDALQVMGVGLDDTYVDEGIDWGHVRRPLPLAKALDDTLLAWEMNGEPLPREHGHPVRLVVPGWVGIASIKWLGELRVTTTRVDSPCMRYHRVFHGAGWEGAD
ncbi:MAG: sulfite oxidase, partial [Actinomycetales bacterium]